MSEDGGKLPLNPLAITIVDVAKLLTRVGGTTVDPAVIEEDVVDGAPVNPDGTMNLVHYAAWLVKELAKRAN